MSSVAIRGLRHTLLRPWTFNIEADLSWLEQGAAVLNVKAKSENLRIDIGPNHVLAFEAIQKYLKEQFPEIFAGMIQSPLQRLDELQFSTWRVFEAASQFPLRS